MSTIGLMEQGVGLVGWCCYNTVSFKENEARCCVSQMGKIDKCKNLKTIK